MMSVEFGQTEPCHKQIQQQYANNYPCWQTLPIFTVAITEAIQIVLFICYCGIGNSVSSGLDSLLESPLIYLNDKRIQLRRFSTYGSLHAGWSHLVFNLLVQVVLELPLEMVQGSTWVAACIYLTAWVVAGSFGSDLSWSDPTQWEHGDYLIWNDIALIIYNENYYFLWNLCDN